MSICEKRVQGLTPLVVLVGVLACGRTARASGHLPGLDTAGAVTIGAAAIVLPSEVGTFVPGSTPGFDLGWSWQIPFTPSLHHRVAGSLDWIPAFDDHRFRGRFGYRYGGRVLFGGAALGFDHAWTTWSPELGLKLLHSSAPSDDLDVSLHLLVRTDLSLGLGHLRAVTVLLGWNCL
jgi:hypothetical protein